MTDSSAELYPVNLIPEHLLASSGFIVHLPPDVRKFVELYESLPLKQQLKTFLCEVLKILEDDRSTGYCSFTEITKHLQAQNLAAGKTMIYERTKTLAEIGLLEEQFYKPGEKIRRTKIYIICKPFVDSSMIAPTHLETKTPRPVSSDPRADSEKTELMLREAYGSQLVGKAENRSYRDSFMATMMAKCIRLDASDPRKMLESNFQYKNTPVDVTTTTLTDGNIAISSDIRYVMVITTFCMQAMYAHLHKVRDTSHKIENNFVIDLSEVATHIGNKRTTGNRLTAYNAAKRLYQTNFEIQTQEESEFAEQFLAGYNEANYRFLSDFRAVVAAATDSDDMFSDEEVFTSSEIKNPRWIKVSLWPSTFESMWGQVVANFTEFGPDASLQFFSQNPAVVQNKSPICYHLYAHLGAWVGVSGYAKKECTTALLHHYMIPNARYQNFFRDLLNLFNGLLPDGSDPITKDSKSFKVNFYGYYVIGRQPNAKEKRAMHPKRGMHLTFYRDVKDDYIGDKSHHNTLRLAAQRKKAEQDALEASGGTEEDSNRSLFKKLQNELGKSPDDIDIPKSQHFVSGATEDGPSQLEDQDLFPE